MTGSASQASSPQEVRHFLIASRIGSRVSPQKAKDTSITSKAGRLPKPIRAPKPEACMTARSRSVTNWVQIAWSMLLLLHDDTGRALEDLDDAAITARRILGLGTLPDLHDGSPDAGRQAHLREGLDIERD